MGRGQGEPARRNIAVGPASIANFVSASSSPPFRSSGDAQATRACRHACDYPPGPSPVSAHDGSQERLQDATWDEVEFENAAWTIGKSVRNARRRTTSTCHARYWTSSSHSRAARETRAQFYHPRYEADAPISSSTVFRYASGIAMKSSYICIVLGRYPGDAGAVSIGSVGCLSAWVSGSDPWRFRLPASTGYCGLTTLLARRKGLDTVSTRCTMLAIPMSLGSTN